MPIIVRTQHLSTRSKLLERLDGESDDEIFVITVNNNNRAPVIATIAAQTVLETNAITTIDANETTTGNDTDEDGDVITYTCYFDNTEGGGVTNTNLCTAMSGTASFDTATGVLDWTPDYDANNSANSTPKYEIKITATANGQSDDEIFVITVNNNNRAPVIATIAAQTVTETNAITTINATENSTGTDLDLDDDVITYTCYYDNTEGGGVANTNLCTTMSGTVSFDTATGVLDWTPDYDANNSANSTPKYEIKITGTANGQSDDEIFVITVNNNDRAPVLATISPQTVTETNAITTINATENSTGTDLDLDGDVISYTCYYDNSVNGGVGFTNLCSNLPGTASFNFTTGVLDWTPSYSANDSSNTTPQYEIAITGTA